MDYSQKYKKNIIFYKLAYERKRGKDGGCREKDGQAIVRLAMPTLRIGFAYSYFRRDVVLL